MNGKIKRYLSDKGYGFILGDDKQDYFFHISEVKSVMQLHSGMTVTFQPEEGEKGFVAKMIYIAEPPPHQTRTPFIVVGSERIKLSNIRDYGIIQVVVYKVKIYEYTEKSKKLLGVPLTTSSYTWKGNFLPLIDRSVKETSVPTQGFGEHFCYSVNCLDEVNNLYSWSPRQVIKDSSGRITRGTENWIEFSDVIEDRVDALYIRTYQKDILTWKNGYCGFDVYEKRAELDDLFSMK